MQLLNLLPLGFLLTRLALALPVDEASNFERGLLDDIHAIEDLILFDAPAFPNPQNNKEVLLDIQTYAFTKLISLDDIVPGRASTAINLVIDALAKLGVDVAEKAQTVRERVKLFLSIGLPGKKEAVIVKECPNKPLTEDTDASPLGLSNAVVSLGQCQSFDEATGSIDLDPGDSRTISNTIHFSPNSGYGVISEIDDTIKITNALSKLELAKATFINDPTPVAGMPDVFKSLAKSLPDPQFMYITGSPFQLYPMLHDFIKSTFPDATGPIWARNVSLADPSSIIDAFGDSTPEYKVTQIDRLQTMYPKKKWLAIGDSGQSDPEAYGQVYKKHKDFIACIWIRKIANATNDQSRFDKAFDGIPKDKFFVFDDKDIPSLSKVRIAKGDCRASSAFINRAPTALAFAFPAFVFLFI